MNVRVDTYAVEDSYLNQRDFRTYQWVIDSVPSVQRAKQTKLVEYILVEGESLCIEDIRKAGQERRAERGSSRESEACTRIATEGIIPMEVTQGFKTKVRNLTENSNMHPKCSSTRATSNDGNL